MNLSALRKEKKMTITTMAQRMKVTRNTVSKMEKEPEIAKMGYVKKYLNVLGYELRILIKE